MFVIDRKSKRNLVVLDILVQIIFSHELDHLIAIRGGFGSRGAENV